MRVVPIQLTLVLSFILVAFLAKADGSATLWTVDNVQEFASLRADKSHKSKRLARLNRGREVQVLRTDGRSGWHYVSVDGQEGWVDPKFLRPSALQIKNVNEFASLRKGKDHGSRRLARLPKGARVEYLATDPKTGWHQVRYGDQKGWVDPKYALPAPSHSDSVPLTSPGIGTSGGAVGGKGVGGFNTGDVGGNGNGRVAGAGMNDDSTSGSSAPVAIPEAPSKYKSEMKKVCGDRARNRPKKTTQVTHYYIPVLGRQSPHPIKCHNMEGVCKYIYDGEEYIYNYTPYKGKTTWAKISAQLRSEYYAKNGKPNKKKGRKKYTPSFTKYATERHERLRDARCKFGIGYGARDNCTHPCRSLAASRKDHEAGQVLYFPELVGKRCGSGSSAMIHDGFMVITDTGSPKKFNHEGRFDFFWGDCKRYNKSSQCLEGNATKFSRILSGGEYCEAWSPRDPLHNEDLALELTNKIRQEAINRNDYRSAASFSLDQFVRGGNLYAQIYGRPRSTAIANRSTPK